MRTGMAWAVAVCVAWWVGGCGSTGPEQSATPAPAPAPTSVTTVKAPAGEIVLEAETCTLKDCAAKELRGAGGGKAVLMDKDSSQAQGTVDLKKGKYKVVVYMQGASADEDAVYITLGQGSRTRAFAEEHDAIVPATLYESEDQFFMALIDKDGPCSVLLTTAEKNVYVDRVVFTRQD